MNKNKKAKDYTKIVRARLRDKYNISLPQTVIYAVLRIFLRNIHLYIFSDKHDIRLRGFFILYYPKNNRDRYLAYKKANAQQRPLDAGH